MVFHANKSQSTATFLRTTASAWCSWAQTVYHPSPILCEFRPWTEEQKANRIYLCISTDESNKAASMLTETLKDSDWGHSYSSVQTPFNSWSKYPGTAFQWYQGVVRVAFHRHGSCVYMRNRGQISAQQKAHASGQPWKDGATFSKLQLLSMHSRGALCMMAPLYAISEEELASSPCSWPTLIPTFASCFKIYLHRSKWQRMKFGRSFAKRPWWKDVCNSKLSISSRNRQSTAVMYTLWVNHATLNVRLSDTIIRSWKISCQSRP